MIRTRLQGDTPFFPNMLNNGNVEVCLKEDVDKTLAEKDKEIAELNATERRLQRALYKACANWAHFAVAFFSSYATKEKWHKMERKCRAKAERYGEGK